MSSAQMSFLSDADTFNTLCAYWASRHPEYVACLRALALRILETQPRMTVDDLREEMASLNLPMPSQIGADDRMFGSVLRACKDLIPVGVQKTRREEWAKRVGATRLMLTVYALKGTV